MLVTAPNNSNNLLNSSAAKKILFICMLALGLLLTGYLIFHTNKEMVILGIMIIIIILLSFKWPEAATLAVLFVLYINIAAVVKEFYGLPNILAGAFSLLLIVPLTKYLFFQKQKIVVDYVLILMFVFLTILLTSSLFAKDIHRALLWIGNYIIEGIVLYFLIINVVRNLAILKKAIWTMVLACSLLGGLSLFQDVTRTYKNAYFGLAQRKVETDEVRDESIYGGSKLLRTRSKVGGTDRAGGPLGGSNRYAQILLVVLPLAMFRYWGDRSRLRKVLALLGALLILSGILLTYSRGAFVTMVIMLTMLALLRYVKFYQLIAIILVLIVFMIVAAPGYFVRIQTILGIEGLFSQSAAYQPDAVTRGRFTEMLAAFMAYLDYPILGVGPGQYTPYYSMKYQLNPDIAFRFLPKVRRAHTLYFELAAETGTLGFVTFMAIVVIVLNRLWRLRGYFVEKNPDISNIATALCFSIIAYLGTAVFLHLSYQRYYWTIIAISGAAIQIFRNEMYKNDNEEKESVSPVKQNHRRTFHEKTVNHIAARPNFNKHD